MPQKIKKIDLGPFVPNLSRLETQQLGSQVCVDARMDRVVDEIYDYDGVEISIPAKVEWVTQEFFIGLLEKLVSKLQRNNFYRLVSFKHPDNVPIEHELKGAVDTILWTHALK